MGESGGFWRKKWGKVVLCGVGGVLDGVGKLVVGGFEGVVFGGRRGVVCSGLWMGVLYPFHKVVFGFFLVKGGS